MNSISISTFTCKLFNRKECLPMNREQFSRWLVGFIDGEGNFQVFLDKYYLRAMFRIRLHKDDINVLNKIQEFLGKGRVVIDGNSCVFIISDTKDLINVLFPLVDEYKLYTTKWLDYNDFKKVVLFLSNSNTTRVSLSQLAWVKNIIDNMNLGRTEFNHNLIPNIIVDPFWLLGFIEAEGTFGFKNLSPFFQVGQHVKNLFILEAIANYLKSIPKGFNFSLGSKAPTVNNSLNKKTSVSVISIVSIDVLYDYLSFFFLNMPFQTRKGIDFYFWCIALYLHKFGYFYLTEGRNLTYKISQYVNSGRYSSNPNPVQTPSLIEINKVLNLNLPVILTPNMSHVDLAKALTSKVKPNAIWVYDNGVLVNENQEPFSSFASAMEAIGYSKTSIAGRRTLDTGKIIGGRYTFYSKPQSQ